MDEHEELLLSRPIIDELAATPLEGCDECGGCDYACPAECLYRLAREIVEGRDGA